MAIKINPGDGTITNGTGGLKLTPGASQIVEINEAVIIPDGTLSNPGLQFSLDSNCGLTSVVDDSVSVAAHGLEAFRVTGVTSAVNYLEIKPSITTAALPITAVGTDTNISINMVPKGSGTLQSGGVNVSLSGHGHAIADVTNLQSTLDAKALGSDLTTHIADEVKHLTSGQNTFLDAVTATSTEVNYTVGTTSAIQTQLDGKSATSHNHTIDSLSNVVITTIADNQALTWDSATSKWVNETISGGETNTASNVGTAGVGVFKQKTGVDLEFKKINAGSSKVTITDDTGNNEVDIDVVEANLTHDSIGGTLGISKGGTGQTTQTAAFDALSPLTTKGDIVVNNGTNDIRLPVGTNTYVLTADSAEASGVKWAAGGGGTNNWGATSGTGYWATFPATVTTAPTCAGTTAVGQLSLGDGAVVASNNNYNIAIGKSNSGGVSTVAIGIGDNTTSFGAQSSYSVAIGFNAKSLTDTGADSGVAIGRLSEGYNSGVGIGGVARAQVAGTVAIGRSSIASATSAIAIGNSASASGSFAITLGGGSGTTGGANSINIGRGNNCGGAQSIMMGYFGNIDTGGDYSICIGSASIGSSKNTVAIVPLTIDSTGGIDHNSTRIGVGASSQSHGDIVLCNGSFGNFANGKPSWGFNTLWNNTTDTTSTRLGTNDNTGGSTSTPTGYYKLIDKQVVKLECTILACRSGATNSTIFTTTVYAKRGTGVGSTAIIGTPTITQDMDDSSGLTNTAVSISADTTNGSINFNVVGLAATNIRWACYIKRSILGYN